MNRSLFILIGLVIAVHLFFFFFDFKSKTGSSLPKKPIVVHVFNARPPLKPTTVPQSKPVEKRKNVKRNKDVQTIKKPQVKSSIEKSKTLKKLKESLKTIEQPSLSDQKEVLILPKKIESLHLDQIETINETNYFILLAKSLKENLELPEYGDVRLELTVLNNGRVLKLRILEALSEKNRKYLELNLSHMILPPFNKELKNEKEHTFTLTFRNET